jgi:hypothetical protein
MKAFKTFKPQTRKVNRARLRQDQSHILKMAKGKTVVVVASRGTEEEKFILDKAYFEELTSGLQAALETLEVMMDTNLYRRLLAAAETIEADARAGKLYSLEEAFREA